MPAPWLAPPDRVGAILDRDHRIGHRDVQHRVPAQLWEWRSGGVLLQQLIPLDDDSAAELIVCFGRCRQHAEGSHGKHRGEPRSCLFMGPLLFDTSPWLETLATRS